MKKAVGICLIIIILTAFLCGCGQKSKTYEENDNVKELVSAGATVVDVPNLYTINDEQRKNKQDYLYFVKNMIENIKTEVY